MYQQLLDLLKPYLASAVRHGLTVAGGIIVKDGLLPSDQLNDFVGGGMLFAGIAWSWGQKYGQAAVKAELARLQRFMAQRQAQPQQSAASGQAVKAAIFLALAFGALLLAHGGAVAQSSKALPKIALPQLPGVSQPAPAPNPLGINFEAVGDQLRKVAKDIVDKAIADLTAASTDAQKHNDAIAQPCWDAQVAFLKLLPVEWDTPPAEIGPALGIQIGRDLSEQLVGQDKGSLKVACAALIGDQAAIVGQIFTIVGMKAGLAAVGIPLP